MFRYFPEFNCAEPNSQISTPASCVCSMRKYLQQLEEPIIPRWTIRGISPQAIRAVQAVQAEIGVSLGEIVTACIETGLNQARRRIESGVGSQTQSTIAPRPISALDAIFLSMQCRPRLPPL